MQTTSAPRRDPIARLCIFALLFLAFYANVATISPQAAKADAQIIILDSTPTPALPTPALAVMDVAPAAPAPPEGIPAAAPAPIAADPVSLDAAPQIAPHNGAGEAAPIMQATIEQPQIDAALNDPALNGGNVAPEGCPFPIINGVCANGVLAKTIDDGAIGQKSIADAGSDPSHVKARSR
jgi:hypothetical protein